MLTGYLRLDISTSSKVAHLYGSEKKKDTGSKKIILRRGCTSLVVSRALGSVVKFPVKASAFFDDIRWAETQAKASCEKRIQCGVDLFVVWAVSASLREVPRTRRALTRNAIHLTAWNIIHSHGYPAMIAQTKA
jgi:hypothetical protein